MPRQLRFSCLFLSGYLTVLSAWVLPHVDVIYSNQGMVGNMTAFGLGETWLKILGALFFGLAVASLFVRQKELCYLPIWIILVLFALQNPYAVTVEQSYLCYLLLAISYALYLERRGLPWAHLKILVWILLGLGYGVAALTKLHSEQWRSGDALFIIFHKLPMPFESFIYYEFARDLVQKIPRGFLTFSTYMVIATQLAFLPSLLWPRARKLAWAAVTASQTTAALLLPIPGICVGMLTLHVFCFPAPKD